MLKNRLANERGQALVVAVLLMVGLLVAVGLALDGGMAFLERRRMQNAADAAVLAGGRDLTMAHQPWVDDDVVQGTIHHYAEENGVEDPENNLTAYYVDANGNTLAEVGAGSIPADATGVTVDVQIERRSRFVHLIGIDVVPASAVSLAQTGPPDMSMGVKPGGGTSGGGGGAGGGGGSGSGGSGGETVLAGLRPFGVPDDLFNDIGIGDTFTTHFGNKNNCGPDKPDNVCTIEYTTADGNKSQAHRGWWNYNKINADQCSSTGGASDLKEWMATGWRGMIYGQDGVCSKPGATSSVFDSAPEGSIVYIPVYDCVEDKRYRVNGITAVRILEANKSGSDKYITAQLVDVVMTGNGQTIPQAIASFNAKMVTLWQ